MLPTRRPLTRRLAILGLAASLPACAVRPPAPPQRRLPATAAVVADPGAAGLNAVIDLSHLNRVADWAAVRACGIQAVVHKATEGWDWVDPTYAERRAAAEAAGLLWGAYHFGTFQRPGAEQAANFLRVAQPTPDTLMALDLELNERNPANSMDLTRAEDFVRTLLAATGRLPLLYVHPAWADGEPVGGVKRTLGGAIRPGSILAACDLWLADYRVRPELPAAWNGRGWQLWQYAGVGGGGGPFREHARQVAGIEACDRNLYCAGPELLPVWWRRPVTV